MKVLGFICNPCRTENHSACYGKASCDCQHREIKPKKDDK